MSQESDETYQNPELWVRELIAAGWTKVQATIWKAPSGTLFRGPYLAWCKMTAQRIAPERKR